ncbi:nuclear transport factor 2 family protein [Streptomyces sp. NPDC012510]|uniref:nuclear transport factor 2 family protein n=1 Tax=Streptomyces sp. NPDC012510 TaxID=3364838 RepID=UPI0036F0DFDA
MSSIDDEIAALRAQLAELTDRAELRDLFDRYVVSLDLIGERDYGDDWFRTVFTDDARFSFPIGDHQGIEGFAAFQREARARWARTHHVTANHVVDIAGERAVLRAHQFATHVHPGSEPLGSHFDVGGYYEVGAVRTSRGWRFDDVAFHVVWAAGEPLPSMAHVKY